MSTATVFVDYGDRHVKVEILSKRAVNNVGPIFMDLDPDDALAFARELLRQAQTAVQWRKHPGIAFLGRSPQEKEQRPVSGSCVRKTNRNPHEGDA